jgi:hypothetical protein
MSIIQNVPNWRIEIRPEPFGTAEQECIIYNLNRKTSSPKSQCNIYLISLRRSTLGPDVVVIGAGAAGLS